MNKSHIFSLLTGFGGGVFAGNQMCKNNYIRMQKGEKLQLDVPASKEDIKERVPKAVSAAAKELVDQRTIDITTGKRKN